MKKGVGGSRRGWQQACFQLMSHQRRPADAAAGRSHAVDQAHATAKLMTL